MALPNLPDGYQQSVYDSLVNNLPGKWFHQLDTQESPLHPLLWGVAGSLGHVRLSYERALEAAIPMLSAGPWLSLHLKSIGLERGNNETDDKAKERYEWEFKPTRNTRAGELAALSRFTGLKPPKLRLEGDRSTGKLGQFRIVLDAKDQPWREVDYSFLGDFISRYVSNGIIPSLDARLQCLLYVPFEEWQFSDQFPMSWNVQGPVWERPSFTSPLTLPFARNLVTQVSAPEWRGDQDRLRKLFIDGLAEAPGALFLYLSDEGHCPNLLAEYDLQLSSSDLAQTFPPRGWDVDGWHFYHEFLFYGPSIASRTTAPFFSVALPSTFYIPPFPPIPLPDLLESEAIEGGTKEVLHYQGLDFTRYKVTEFFETTLPATGPEFTSPRLRAMCEGAWQLALTEGDDRWGNTPPQGSILTGEIFALLNPESVWWTDSTGEDRAIAPLWDGEAIYFGVEFILPKGSDRIIREVELRLNGDRLDYRRLSLPITAEISTGFVFKVKGFGVTP
jgi:hypothetical protein